MNIIPKWGPRLARLYSENVRRLEALHADRISPGARTWDTAVEALFERVTAGGPAKGAKLVQKVADYLDSITSDQRCHLLIALQCRSRNAFLMFATFSYGNHPNPAVAEQGLNIELHVIHCSRSHPSRAIGVPVAYISKHAMNRLFERGHDVTENTHASSVFAFITVLGYLTHHSAKHVDGGMHIASSNLLAAGAMHRFTKTHHSGKQVEERFFDVRTVLDASEIGPSRQNLLDQGRAAASVTIEWLKNVGEELDEKQLAERIPRVERREDHYPLRQKEKTP